MYIWIFFILFSPPWLLCPPNPPCFTAALLLLLFFAALFYLFIFKFYVCMYLFIYLWLCWVFISVRGLSLVVVSGGHSSSQCTGLSLSWPLLLRSTGSRRAGSVIVAQGPSCSAACGIFPVQGSNPYPLHWQADSQPLRHQGSPAALFIMAKIWTQPKCLLNVRVHLLFHSGCTNLHSHQ